MTLQLLQKSELRQDLEAIAETKVFPLIRTATWLPFLDFYLPALLADDGFPALIYLIQNLALSLTQQKYCTTCRRPLPDHPRPQLNLCQDCFYSDWGRYIQCILKGSGAGFIEEQDALGTPCDPCRDPLCRNPPLFELCAAPHIVYLATFNTQIKVGTARVNRWGFAHGYLLRLLEQGLDYALFFTPHSSALPLLPHPLQTFSPFPTLPFRLRTSTFSVLDGVTDTQSPLLGFSLSEAQALESWIMENFSQITEKLTFYDKFTEILNTGPNPNLYPTPELVQTRQEVDELAKEIVQLYSPLPLQKSPSWALQDNIYGTSSVSDAIDAPVSQNPLDLVCTVKYARGNLVLAYHPRLGRDFWFNTSHLLGRGIVMEEPWV